MAFIKQFNWMWIVRLIPATILIYFFNFGLETAWLCMVADLVVRGLHFTVRGVLGRCLERLE